MRIRDLLEGKNFNDLDFVKQEEDGRGIDFDLAEDLSFFMSHDDDTYRRHVYPTISKCLEMIKNKKSTKPSVFKAAVEESYKNYLQKYPIRELPDQLDNEMYEEICSKLHDDFCKHVEEGKYKD